MKVYIIEAFKIGSASLTLAPRMGGFQIHVQISNSVIQPIVYLFRIENRKRARLYYQLQCWSLCVLDERGKSAAFPCLRFELVYSPTSYERTTYTMSSLYGLNLQTFHPKFIVLMLHLNEKEQLKSEIKLLLQVYLSENICSNFFLTLFIICQKIL